MIERARADDFLETLPFRGRILVRRLESFGDIVVGFSLSQLALQLGLPQVPADLIANPFRYFLFFSTFSFLALAWLRFHRMLTTGFAPGRIDLICAFAYLAFIALLPYALYASSRFSGNETGARYGIAAYTICLLGSSMAAFCLSARSLKRASGLLGDGDLARLRQRTYIEGGLTLIFSVGLLFDFVIGPARASFVFLTIPILVRVIRIRNKAPGWSAVHVHGHTE